MSSRLKWAIAATTIAAVFVVPSAAQAVFPGANGKILYVSGRDTGGDPQADIYIIKGPGDVTPAGPLTILPGQHRHPAWSADAKFITFALWNGADQDIWLHDVRLGSNVRIPDGGSAAGIQEDHPTFSPNGRKIAYESEVTDGSGQSDILIANADGSGTPLNLTNTATAIEQTPVWSPNGKFVYYARKPNAASTDFDLLREPANNSSDVPHFITTSAAPEWQPDISPDGKKLCYLLGAFGSAEADVMVTNVSGIGEPVEISPIDSGMTAVADYDCAWSPNGKKLAWTRGAFTAGEIQFAPSDDSGPVTPYADNSAFFDGNVDWARSQKKCKGKLVTILGTKHKDHLSGTPKRDVFVALGGADEIRARGGNDLACGNGGNDRVSGAGGNDHLFGQGGGDHLAGGGGSDLCDGGPGDDSATGCEVTKGI